MRAGQDSERREVGGLTQSREGKALTLDLTLQKKTPRLSIIRLRILLQGLCQQRRVRVRVLEEHPESSKEGEARVGIPTVQLCCS